MTGRDVAGQAAQQLAWDVEGELAEVRQDGNGDGDMTDADERDSYVNTADGERVLRTQDGTTTLYLGYQELTLNHDSGTVSGERYYTFAGQTIATRTGYFAAEVTTITGDHHNTGSVQIPNVAGPASRVHRYTDPYGKPRGPHGGTGADGGADGNWTGEHGYLDKPIDSTGLTAIGARMYDPALGAFISVDPIMDLADPQQWNAYGYSNNNPTTFSDPTGKRYEECGTTHNCQMNSKGNVTSAKKYKKRKPTINDKRSRWRVAARSRATTPWYSGPTEYAGHGITAAGIGLDAASAAANRGVAAKDNASSRHVKGQETTGIPGRQAALDQQRRDASAARRVIHEKPAARWSTSTASKLATSPVGKAGLPGVGVGVIVGMPNYHDANGGSWALAGAQAGQDALFAAAGGWAAAALLGAFVVGTGGLGLLAIGAATAIGAGAAYWYSSQNLNATNSAVFRRNDAWGLW
ncbi:RHS repeat-associated core domain-containing protein [Promicromonospora sp. CA-289599]|uniref:RHS repeat-associated core domain-containing protein n=1 Tax=Promicromonospora sp. CA-289599 TaxID=3240014 RepID=UPI003D8F7A1B